MVGDKNDVDIGIHALDLLRQHGPVQAETVENRVGQQHVAPLGLSKRQGGIGMIEAMQFRVRDDLRDLLPHGILGKSIRIHMDDLHNV